MIRAVSYLPLALLFLASAVPSNGQMRRSEADVSEREVTVQLGAPLTVECPLRPEQVADWRRNGGDIPRDMRVLEAPDKTTPDALTARLTAPAAAAHHAGVYTCAKASPRIRVKVTGICVSVTVSAPA
ncbi:hypothetical protein NE865_07439 [Phthorimaea operculella]|nr:hypothetical protein NE865_07439 [Phthorimaea operculella]